MLTSRDLGSDGKPTPTFASPAWWKHEYTLPTVALVLVLVSIAALAALKRESSPSLGGVEQGQPAAPEAQPTNALGGSSEAEMPPAAADEAESAPGLLVIEGNICDAPANENERQVCALQAAPASPPARPAVAPAAPNYAPAAAPQIAPTPSELTLSVEPTPQGDAASAAPAPSAGVGCAATSGGGRCPAFALPTAVPLDQPITITWVNPASKP